MYDIKNMWISPSAFLLACMSGCLLNFSAHTFSSQSKVWLCVSLNVFILHFEKNQPITSMFHASKYIIMFSEIRKN
jgi:hypothetical protein